MLRSFMKLIKTKKKEGINMGTKVCRKCNKEKDVSEFNIKSDNKDKLSSYCKKCNSKVSLDWQFNNRDRFNEYKRNMFKKPQQRVAHRGRVQLRKILRNLKPGYKFLVECGAGNKEELIRHLISTIPEGYSFDDYGTKLCIDHIIPCSYYDLTKHADYLKCFNYKNLRLVTYETNCKKGKKIAHINNGM